MLVCRVEIEETAAEKEIRRCAERHRGAGFGHAPPVLAIEVDAVRVNGAVAQEAVVVVHVEIAAAPRKDLLDPGDFGAVFGNVRLQVDAGMLIEQSSGKLQLPFGRRRREARRDGVEQTIAAVPTFDQGV